MSGSGSDRNPEDGRPTARDPKAGSIVGWLRTPTGIVVGIIWLALLVTVVVVLRPTVFTAVLEVGAILFGLYATSVAFRKDRTAGYVILIALAFSFLLLNSALYLPGFFPYVAGR